MGETMNTDKPDKVEGMAEKEAGKDSPPQGKGWMKKALRLSFYIVLICAALLYISCLVLQWYMSRPTNAPVGACKDNLRTIDSAIIVYEADNGKGVYPNTMEELIPTYIRQMPKEPTGGCYYLDMTTTPPHAVCSKGHIY
jgi:hypothetical protein